MSSSFSCPRPYQLNQSLGLCVEPSPPGFSFLNGQFVRNCPTGMTMNDLGVCIRPVMTRKSFISDASIQQTTLAIGGNSAEGGTNAVVFGIYDKSAYDVTFQNSQLLNEPVTQIKLSPGSESLFLVAQNSASSPSNSLNSQQQFLSLKAITKTSVETPTATINSQDTLPSSVRKMEYSSAGVSGQMYFLGQPATKIFLADYPASLYTKAQNVNFNFNPEVFSVEGTTDPFYAGSIPTIVFDESGNVTGSQIGAFQSGSANANPDPNLVPPSGLGNEGAGAQTQCPNDTFWPQTPIDPLPAIFTEVTDATSRKFQRDVQTTSYGYVLVGSQNGVATAYAARYLQTGTGSDYDSCPLQNPPKRPFVQTLQNVELSAFQSSQKPDIRVARFDVDSDTNGNPDSIYVYGMLSEQSGPNPVLMFNSENHNYNTTGYFGFSFGLGLVPPAAQFASFEPQNSNGMTTIIGQFVPTADSEIYCKAFVNQLNEILLNAYPGNIMPLQFNQTNWTTFGALTIDLIAEPAGPNFYASLYFAQNEFIDMTSTRELLGFQSNNTWYTLNTQRPTFSCSEKPIPSANELLNEYNGFSTTDTSTRSNGAAMTQLTPIIVKGANNEMVGQNIDAWCFDNLSQSLAFSISSNTASSGLGSTSQTSGMFLRTTYTFNVDSASFDLEIPQNCVDIEVHLWGAGGSSMGQGKGGAGAYVSGHLDIAKLGLQALETIKIVVGSGGTASASAIAMFGSGGQGNFGPLCKGGGRSAIQRMNRDIVTSGGGGGSSGNAQSSGGAASATELPAESGLPDSNGGRGATHNSPGLGGIVFGDTRYRRAPDGGQFRGGPSCSSLFKSALGAGGGGSGYYGGGSGAYLGNKSPSDLPTGSGGGSSFSSNLLRPILISGTREIAPQNTKFNFTDIAYGGTIATRGLGGHGRVTVIFTTTENENLGSQQFGSGSSFSDQIWACRPKAFSSMADATLWGSSETSADWTSLFAQLKSPYSRPTLETRAIFTGLQGLIIYAQQDTATGQSFVSWTILTTATTAALLEIPSLLLGPLNYLSNDGLTQFAVDAITNIRSIRQVGTNSRDIIFIGDGIRVLSAPSVLNGSWSNPRFVIDNLTGMPISNFALNDAKYNEKDQVVEIIGAPANLAISTMHKTPWMPQFASFYDNSDIVTEFVPFLPWTLDLNPLSEVTNNNSFSINGVGPLINQNGTPFAIPNVYVTTPNTLFCARLLDTSNSVLVDFVSVTLFDHDETSVTIASIATKIENALQAYINYCSTKVLGLGQPTASVFVAPFNILDITFVDLGKNVHIDMAFTVEDVNGPWDWQNLFKGTNSVDAVGVALGSAGRLMGFSQQIISSITQASGQGKWESSLQGSFGIQLVPSSSSTTSSVLTPLSVALPENSTFAGSMYHVYAPTVKLAVVDSLWPNNLWANGIVVASGGPIASPVHTTINNTDSNSFLDQPVPLPGSKYFIDYVQSQDLTWSWNYSDGTLVPSVYEALNSDTISIACTDIRSPANVLFSLDGGSSYSYTESLLGSYLRSKSLPSASTFALTALDAFHIYKGPQNNDGPTNFGIGPAKMFSQSKNSGSLNAAVSQFNDIKFIPYEASYNGTTVPGFFIGVGQFLWELNALASCTWPTSINQLNGVAWVSLDGLSWTTMPIVTANNGNNISGSAGGAEMFWQCTRLDYVDTTNDNATLITDVGLYMINIERLMTNIVSIFTQGPILNFSSPAPNQIIFAVPIGLNGPFAAHCTSRDATGTCIKCLKPSNGGPAALPVSLPQIIGAGGAIQPNFDCCISAVRGDESVEETYTSVESAVDAYGLSAYAGFEAKNTKIKSYKQSFFAESALGPSNDSLIICPRFTDYNETPAGVIGIDGHVADQMQCALDNALQKTSPSLYANVNGITVVRLPGTLDGRDTTYSSASQYIESYVKQTRWVTLVPYDSKINATSKQRTFVTDTCPSTLGIGGSAIAGPLNLIGSPDAYPISLNPNSYVYNSETVDLTTGIRLSLLTKLTNKGAFGSLDGPFFQNKSLESSAGANWAPGSAPFDRAILANDDFQSDFSYANQGTKLVYNSNQPNDPTKQTQNPFLYRLSSFEFPFDGQSSAQKITPGRDPQVYEPGFGSLKNYLSANEPGFARSIFNESTTPWPTNPLPEEGFGYWWIRPNVAQQGLIKGTDGLFQSALGYGTLIFQQQLGFYGNGDHQGYAWPSNTPASKAETLFCYDTLLAPSLLNKKYFEQNWTKYLPFQNLAPSIFTTDTLQNNSWSALNLANSFRAQRAQYSLHNLMTLKLWSKPEPVPVNLASTMRTSRQNSNNNNWKFLVGLNFFRPRNWAFSGLLVDDTGSQVQKDIGFGVSQQVLTSDQPDELGRYEFLIPDPYFAAWPTATGYGARSDLIGIRTLLQGPSATDLPTILKVLGVSSVPSCLAVIETPVGASYAQTHSAWHYWTYNSTTSTAILDLYINVSKLFATSFEWIGNCTLQNAPYEYQLLEDILNSSGPSNTFEKGLIAAILKYNGNPIIGGPLNSFVWTDPSSQTTRSLASMNLQCESSGGQKMFVFDSSEIIQTLNLLPSGLLKRQKNLLTIASDYDSTGFSLLHHRYTVPNGFFGPKAWPVGQILGPLASQNANALNLIGLDSANSPGRKDAVVGPADPRGLASSDNFIFRPSMSVLNVTTSDYNVETDNSGLFSSPQEQKIVQDLMAQTFTDGDQYGSPTYGFGLRIDDRAISLENCTGAFSRPTISATLNSDLPMDHGYVSMVRTCVDSFERYTDPNQSQIMSIDAWPHVTRLTYVTKYVPSKLQAYGAIVPYQPMRFLAVGDATKGGAAQLQGLAVEETNLDLSVIQNVPNPFRPRSTYLIENVPIGPLVVNGVHVSAQWIRPNDIYGSVNGQFQNDLLWSSWSSNVFDFESPGFWGRQKLPFQNAVITQFFDATGMENVALAEIFNSSSKYLFAGYEGIWDNQPLFLNGSNSIGPNCQSFRSAFNSTQEFVQATLNYSTNGSSNYMNWLKDNSKTIAGQMLVNLLDAINLDSNSATDEIRIELGFYTDSQNSNQFRGRINCQEFFRKFIVNTGGAYFQVLGLNVQNERPLLVTHAELATIFQIAMTAWLNDASDPTFDIQTYGPSFGCTFDAVTDRPSFQFQFANGACSKLRLFVPSPLSNWLGLVNMNSPMYNIAPDNGKTNLNYSATYGSLIPFGKDYTYNYSKSNFTTYLNNYGIIEDANWNSNSAFYISPWDWTRISCNMINSMDPQQPTCSSGNPTWLIGEGPAVIHNWNYDGLYINMQMEQNCTSPTSISAWLDKGPLQTWCNYGTFGSNNLNFVGIYVKLLEGNVSYPQSRSVSFANSPLPCSANSWTTSGWTDAQNSPIYSLYWENTSGSSEVFFSGRKGLNADNSFAMAQHGEGTDGYTLCDISNVSWTTRLAASFDSATYANTKCAHWWGFVSASPSLESISTFTAYHADSSLITFNASTKMQTQSAVPGPALFMSSLGTAQTLSSNSTSQNLSACTFLDAAWIPAIEVPCPYGNVGLDSVLRNLTKPANFDSLKNPASSVLESGSPNTEVVVSADAATALLNWRCATRQTFGALVPLNPTATTGTIAQPFQLKLGAVSASVPSVPKNTWRQAPPQNPASTSTFTAGTTDANALAVFMVSDSCYVNVGPTAFNTGSQGQYTRLGLYAFNYSDLFAANTTPQPWLQNDSNSLRAAIVDSSAYLKTYLRGTPYYMDESYDGNAYSTLGRSLFIDSSMISSATGQPLQVSTAEPVVLILCPVSFSPQAKFSRTSGAPTGTNLITNDLLNTYSNSLLYSFTEPYAQSQNSGLQNYGPQVYNLAFTDPFAGPAWTFYGLDNKNSVSRNGTLGVQASKFSTSPDSQTFPRKVYRSFTNLDNESLGLDVRQVYPQVAASSSLIIANDEPLTDPFFNTGALKNWPLALGVSNAYTFQYTTLENPDWNNPSQISSSYLPLAGTWSGDRDANWIGDAASSGIKVRGAYRQMIPNYDGLSLLAEWQAGLSEFNVVESTALGPKLGPGFTMYAVDRTPSIRNPIQSDSTSTSPVSIAMYNQRRPQTVFSLLCDQWRNTIREPKALAGTQSWLLYASGVATSPALTNGDGSAFLIDYVDCMGPSDYNVNDATNNGYFGMCNGTAQNSSKSLPSIVGQYAWAATPWASQAPTQNDLQVWSPFTGGSYWNTFKGSSNLSDTASDPAVVSFGPNLWWPTYRWALAATDPNNVLPTSVASNETLQLNSFVLFTCTDGTIRKMKMPASGSGSAGTSNAFPVVESTSITTFYNNDINAPDGNPRVYSYTAPGRLYNLTFFANHWWCTADNSSVWTTAPCLDGTPINDPGLVSGFFASIIKFRPLSANEGHPENWITASWPSNAPHRYNIAKIIKFNNISALFIGSVDGEYIVINQVGTGFQSTLPDTDYSVPWLFPNTTTYTDSNQTTMLYVTDIAILGQSLIVGSSVLPLDPQTQAAVPWSSASINLALPLLSLTYSLPYSLGPSLLMNGVHNIWPGTLENSNVITTLSSPSIQNTVDDLDMQAGLELVVKQLQADTIGREGSFDTFTSTGYTLYDSKNANNRNFSGLKRMARPANLGANNNDSNMIFFIETETNSRNTKLSTTTIGSFYGIVNSQSQSNLGSTLLTLQHSTDFVGIDSFWPTTGPIASTTKINTFHKGGFTMDRYSRAFFVIDDVVSNGSDSGGSGSESTNYGLGLKQFILANTNSVQNYQGTVNDNTTDKWNASYVRTFSTEQGSGPSPMWNRSVAMTFSTGYYDGQIPDDSYASAYTSSLKNPLNGPLDEFSNVIKNFNDLNLYQTMNIKRSANVPANVYISDMAYAENAQAVAFTTAGPFGPLGPTIAQIVRTSNTTQWVPLSLSPARYNIEPRFTGSSIIAWNPYELKWYAAGSATNMPDVDFNNTELLRPAGIDAASWNSSVWDPTDKQLSSNNTRLMIISADASLGPAVLNTDNALESIGFTQVFQVSSRNGSDNAPILKPISRNFSAATCIAFSPNAVVVGGMQQSGGGGLTTEKTLACLMWRTNTIPSGDDLRANWSFVNLKATGAVTAIKFVGYAWYIATWDKNANNDANGVPQGQSSLFFASINFTVVSLLDTWSGMNSTLNINSIESTTLTATKCNKEDGFEVDPNNPNGCVKICPAGYKAFGNLCVLNCPRPYIETGVPNECQPDVQMARTINPTIGGINPDFEPTSPLKNLALGPENTSVNYGSMPSLIFIGLVFVILLMSFFRN